MILERELYKSISTTRAIINSLRVYVFEIFKRLFISKKKHYRTELERGLPELVNSSKCSGCSDCESICPTNALAVSEVNDKLDKIILDVKKCIFCGLCADVCEPQVLSLTDRRPLASHGESDWTIDLVQSE